MNSDTGRKRILVVDDQPANIHILIDNLEDEYDIAFATNGDKALRIASSHEPPDLILLDILMPEMDGYQVCTKLKVNPRTQDIPVIFITASGHEDCEKKGLQVGAIDYIAKPFRMPIVKARILSALRLKEEMDRRMRLAQRLEDLNRNLEQRVKDKTLQLELANEKLTMSERKYRAIYENAIEGIFQTTRDGHVLSASPSMAAILGYKSADDLIANISDISRQLYVRTEDRTRFRQLLEHRGEVTGFETQFKKKNGDVIDVLISAKMILDGNGEFSHYQGFNIDITEQKRAKELEAANIRLKELDALKTALMSTASHDMRAPLTSILGFAQLIDVIFTQVFHPLVKGNAPLEIQADKIKRFLKTIELEGERLIRLINDFLDLSKFESGCSEWRDSPVQMSEIIDMAVRAVKGQLLVKPQLELRVHTDNQLLTIVCDADRLMQLMVNLLSNAIKFTQRGTISVSAERVATDTIEVRVSDTGPGIPEEERERVFDKFYQLKRNAKAHKDAGSTGLGLAICKHIVEHYGGVIWVESEPKVGSTFVFQLKTNRNATRQPATA